MDDKPIYSLMLPHSWGFFASYSVSIFLSSDNAARAVSFPSFSLFQNHLFCPSELFYLIVSCKVGRVRGIINILTIQPYFAGFYTFTLYFSLYVLQLSHVTPWLTTYTLHSTSLVSTESQNLGVSSVNNIYLCLHLFIY